MNVCIYKHEPRVEVTLRILEAYEKAFQHLGHDVIVLSHDMYKYTLDEAREFAKKFLEFDPTVALCYGFAAMPEVDGSFFFRKRGIPLIILCFENPFFGLDDRIVREVTSYPDYYYLFVWDTFILDILRNQIKHCYPIRHAAQIGEDTCSMDRKPECLDKDVSFVGNIPAWSGVEYENVTHRKTIESLIDEFISWKLQRSDGTIIEYLRENRNGENGNGYFQHPSYHQKIIYPIYAEGLGIYRRTVLDGLDMFDVHYFGDTAWNAAHITFHSPVSYNDELPVVYRSSKVNIDIPPFQSIDSVSNRIFDVAAAKSLVLTEAKPDLHGVFHDPDWITYHSLSELVEKTRYYIDNGAVRETVAKNLYTSICTNHTYEHRVEYITTHLATEGVG